MTPAQRAQFITDIRVQRQMAAEAATDKDGKRQYATTLPPQTPHAIVEFMRRAPINVGFLLRELDATRRAMYLLADALQHEQHCRTCGEEICDNCVKCSAEAALAAAGEIMPLDLAIWHNDYDWVIARDVPHVREVCRALMGEMTDEELGEWERLDDAHVLTMRDETFPDGKATMTCREWIAFHGQPCHMGSTEC